MTKHDKPTQILVVDDDPALAAMLVEYLELHGFSVTCVGDGQNMDLYLRNHAVDLVLLDLMLPGEDGLSIVRRLSGGVPVLMMSARAEDADRIAGLEIGAEDFVAKPFNPRELLARIRVALRRRVPVQEPKTPYEYVFGDFRLDAQRRTLHRAQQPVALSAAEFSLLRVLVEYSGRVLSRDELLDKARALNERLPFDRSIDARVARLRRKIEDDPAEPRYLKTVRGMGYLFDVEGGR
jgi:DNA-binding response OmpR family regulator